MRLPEQRLYDWMQRKIGHVAMLERVENRVKKDTPDLYIAAQSCGGASTERLHGWIELKVLEAFPARATTGVKIPHWTTGQRYWAQRHAAQGGCTWLVVRVQDRVFVFNAAAVAGSIDAWTRDDWHRQAVVIDMQKAKADAVIYALDTAVL